MKRKITIGTELEFSELHKGKVKPVAGTGYIPFYKRYLGRIVHVLIPKEEKYCWILTKEDLKLLFKEAKNVKFEQNRKYWKQDKEDFEDCIKNLKNSPESFDLSDLKNIVWKLEDTDFSDRRLITKIKKYYNF